MLRTSDNRRLFTIGIVTIIISIMALVNNLIEVDFEVWISLAGFGLSFLMFLWAYFVDREAYAAVGAYVMAAIMGMIVITTWFSLEGVIIPTFVLAAIALPFLLAWLNNQQNWGMLIPAYVLLAIIPILYMNETIKAELVPAYVLTAIALPFLMAYFTTRKLGWLIPSGIMLVVALSFVGLAFGMPSWLMSVGLPVLAILVGLYFLWQAMQEQPDDRQEI